MLKSRDNWIVVSTKLSEHDGIKFSVINRLSSKVERIDNGFGIIKKVSNGFIGLGEIIQLDMELYFLGMAHCAKSSSKGAPNSRRGAETKQI